MKRHRIVRLAALAGAAAALTVGVAFAIIGALPSQPSPIWTQTRSDGPTTSVQGANAWVDEFNHGLSFGTLGPDYVQFEGGVTARSDHWRHAEHWMSDIEATGDAFAAIALRPNRSFRFEGGMLVIETVVASRIDTYGNTIWPEGVLTTAAAPTSARRDALYLYDQFAGHYTLGCRLQAAVTEGFTPVCALFDNTERGATNGGRIWEVSSFQHTATGQSAGGYATAAFPPACNQSSGGQDADTACRSLWRFELTPSTLTVLVDGSKFFIATGLDLPAAFTGSPLYAYFGTTAYRLAAGTVVRTHWDRIAVNPHLLGVPPTPSPSPTPSPLPSPTLTPIPTPTPVPPTYRCSRIDSGVVTVLWEQAQPGRTCP